MIALLLQLAEDVARVRAGRMRQLGRQAWLALRAHTAEAGILL